MRISDLNRREALRDEHNSWRAPKHSANFTAGHSKQYYNSRGVARGFKTNPENTQKNKGEKMARLLGCDNYAKITEFRWDDEALWSFTDFKIGEQICNHLLILDGITRESVITDAFASVGGNTIQFAMNFSHVNAVELDETRKEMLDHNLKLFNIDNVTTHSGYFQTFAARLQQDIIFFDPPWGQDYRKHRNNSLRITLRGTTGDISLEELIGSVRRRAQYCAVKLPFNYDHVYFTNYLDEHMIGEVINMVHYPRPNTMDIVFVKFF